MPERSFSVRLSARVDEYVNAMNKARASTGSFSAESEKNLKRVGGQMQNVGGNMTRYVTLPIVAAGSGALKLGYDFEQAFARMQGLAGVPAQEIEILKREVLDLAGETATAPMALADALYEAASAGLTAEQAMAATSVAARASAAGMGSAHDVVGLVASALSAYGEANITAAEATDVLTQTIREGRADPAELAGTLGRILPFAAQLGVSFDEVGGTVAYLSNVFGDTNRTVTAMSGLFAKLLSPTQQGREALADMGTSVAELQAAIDSRGLLGALELLRSKGFAGNQQALTALFDDIEGRQAAITLLNDNSGKLAATIDAVTDSTGALSDAYKTASGTDAFRMKQAFVDLQTAATEVGAVLLPVAAQAADFIGDIVDVFMALPGPVRSGVLTLLAAGAALGPLVWAGGTVVKNLREIAAQAQFVGSKLRLTQGGVDGAERSLTGMGRAARTAAIGLGAVAAVAVGGEIYNEISGASDTATRSLQRLNIAIGDVSKGTADGSKVMKAFRDLVAAEDDQFKIDNFKVWGDSMDDLVLIGGKTARTMNDVKDAFRHLLDQSPEQAAVLIRVYQEALDELGVTLDGMDPTSPEFEAAMDQFRENNDVVRFMIDIYGDATGAQAALNDAVGNGTEEMSAWERVMGDIIPKHWAAADALADETAATEAATTALEAHIDALQRDAEAQQQLIDQARAGADSTFALHRAQSDWNDALAELPNKIKDAEGDAAKLAVAYDSVADAAATLADAAVTDAVNDGWIPNTEVAKLDTFNRKMLELAASTEGPARDSIVLFLAETNKIPAETVATIVAAVDPYGLDAADQALDDASVARDAAIKVDADTAAADTAIAAVEDGSYEATVKVHAQVLAGNIRQQIANALGPFGGFLGLAAESADGRFVDGPMFSLIGEAGAEVVLPLTRPDRMRDLLADPRVGPKVLAAFGGRAFADGGIIGRVLQAGGGTGSGSTQDQLQANMFEAGALDASSYRAYLSQRLGDFEKFSDEWMSVWRDIKSLDDDEAAARAQQVKDAEDAAAAEIAAEDQRMAAMYELGQISQAQYEAYLQKRLGDFDTYSAEWMTRWRELASIQEQAEQDAERRREDEAAAALRRLEILYDRAEARRDLAVAERELGESWQDVSDAQAAVAQAADDDERARAQQQVTAALLSVADDAWEGAKARARTLGLEEGTAEWARFIRSEVGAYAAAHPELAGRLDEYLKGVPRLAAGAYVPAQAGGMFATIAEGGHDEWVLPDHKLRGALVSAVQLAGGGQVETLLRQLVDRVSSLENGPLVGHMAVSSNDEAAIGRQVERSLNRLLWQKKAGARG